MRVDDKGNRTAKPGTSFDAPLRERAPGVSTDVRRVTNDALNKALESLNESHERFVHAMVEDDDTLAILAYRNYVLALARVFKEMPFSE